MNKLFYRMKTAFWLLLVLLVLAWMGLLACGHSPTAQAQGPQAETFLPLVVGSPQISPTPTLPPNPAITDRTVNAPYFINNSAPYTGMTVFWFGKVNETDVYGDVRVGYNDTNLYLSVNMIDRLLWYDTTPSLADLDQWDAVSIYLSMDATPGNTLSTQETRWLAQLANTTNREDYQAAFQGNGSNWQSAALPFSTEVRFQGEVNGAGSGKGWSVNYRIPWSSLGYDVPPPQGTLLGLGVTLHDRDSAAGPPRADTVWPEALNTRSPQTWGGLHLGLLTYQPPGTTYDGLTEIRNGEQGAVVEDAHVGGAFDCGESVAQDWVLWGNKNYETVDPTQVNIQNQWNIDDWPCFSKYYVTFPLDLIPANSEIVSATLTMYHFGNSDPSLAPRSNIHVFIVREAWQDTTITWNNAPLAWTNISRLGVDPLASYPGWPGVPYHWDVSLAVLDAQEAGTPLRLALYSSDYPLHSGKYFRSSNIGVGDPNARPYLTVYWRNP